MTGQTITHYEVLDKLGAGGMGVVYRGRDLHLNRFVALKFLAPEMTRDDNAKQRFIREAQAASALDHPNICTIHEIAETPDGQSFIVMACYEGETLKDRLERGPLKLDDALDIALGIGAALVAAHESGIVHRDIKPGNVMFLVPGGTNLTNSASGSSQQGEASSDRSITFLHRCQPLCPSGLRTDSGSPSP